VTATPRAVELVETAALAAADKLADGIIAYDVSDQLVITDAFVLCSASNERQVRAIVDEIELRMRQAGAGLVRREGEREGRWVLLDYLDVVIHVQRSDERTYYSLERIWKDCPQIPLPELVTAGPGGRPPGTRRSSFWGDPSPQTPLGRDPSPQTPLAPPFNPDPGRTR
jgi:ribosome-associated protein